MGPEQRAAVIVFLDEEGKVLMHHRGRITSTGEEWGFLGGVLHKTQVPENFVKEKVFSEVGYRPERVTFFRQYALEPEKGNFYIVDVFTAPFPGMESFHDTHAAYVSELRLFSIAEAQQQNTFPLAHRILKDLQDRVGRESAIVDEKTSSNSPKVV